MLRRSSLLLLSVSLTFVLACAKKEDKAKDPPPPPPPVAADAAATGSAAGSADGSAGSADGSGSAGSAAGSGDGSAAAGSGDAVKFDKLAHEDKVKFMKTKVMPAMKAHFQKFDAKEFANFTCKTCHGKDPQKTKYEMPNKELPVLDFDAIKAGKEDAKIVEFMGKVVKPEMAKILGEPEMTETVHDGFGCLDCHTMKQKK